ncbi:MAG: GNAT family N-acetyltransferase [gamma proteobacterium symbiont of Taylorina sp.]|nr:GNAT family N-acetyltransferase [gamma proteobacterium symbiont of Taylorina sp.]
MDKKYNRYPHLLPVLKLARLAVDKKLQRQGYAKLLLANVIHKAIIISEQVGITGITLDAKDTSAAAMYKKYGFISLGDKGLNLFLPINLCRMLKP